MPGPFWFCKKRSRHVAYVGLTHSNALESASRVMSLGPFMSSQIKTECIFKGNFLTKLHKKEKQDSVISEVGNGTKHPISKPHRAAV